jgi:NAD(P)H-hydrate epimerase
VRIVSVVELAQLSGDAQTNARIASRAEIGITIAANHDQLQKALAGASTIVDCLLGTGAQGPLRGIYADAVKLANEIDKAVRIAIDIPTGLDCDSGMAAAPTFTADHTITFVARKVGFAKDNADSYVGVVHEVGIGVPAKLLREL